jgi:hypothetical protein
MRYDAEIQGTDSLAGKSARFFQKGKSEFRLVFEKGIPPGIPTK